MKKEAAELYRCPYSGSPLGLTVGRAEGNDVLDGVLVNETGREYLIRDGVPDFRDPLLDPMEEEEGKQFAYYESTSAAYDTALDWLFATFIEDEDTVRGRLMATLDLESAARVLEIGAGTCRDSIRIASRMRPGSRLFLQDFSPSILRVGRQRMDKAHRFDCEVEYFLGSAAHLPFAAAAVDCVYTFGAFNVFPDRRGCLAAMTRIVRRGGRVVFGDESLAPWLKTTEYGATLLDANPLYADAVPIEVLPESARDVRVEWLLGNAFYIVSYEVGEGPPAVNPDLPIPGRRGGTLRSRRYGKVEAVSPEAKELAEQEAQRLGISIHEWLDRAIRGAVGTKS
ncbi:MAG TPA: class I SAM-dependent methyltransferase [Thermoanaerobaculia bacterium]